MVYPNPANQFTMQNSIRRLVAFAGALLITSHLVAAESVPVKSALTVESDALRLVIGANAHTLEFTDKSSASNYATRNPGVAFARVKKVGKFFDATVASLTEGRLVLEFAGAGASAALKFIGAKHSVTVEALSVTGDGVEEFVFADVPLTLNGAEADRKSVV